MNEYKINFEFMQTNCFWFEPKKLCKSPEGNGVCIPEAICPILKGKEMEGKKDNHVPGEKWEFNESVARVFDDMLNRSIPQIDVMRNTVQDIANNYMKSYTKVIDVGCARGDAIAGLVKLNDKIGFLGLDVSQSMLIEADERFCNNDNVEIKLFDVKDGINSHFINDTSVILSVLTLQFIPIEYRMQVVHDMYENLIPGGCLIVVEKILGEGAEIDKMFQEMYYKLKGQNGYSLGDIRTKKLALEGVLVPITAKWNVELMKSAGFRQVDCFWRWMNFAGWVAIK